MTTYTHSTGTALGSTSVTLAGANGYGYVDFPSQALAPSRSSSRVKLYSDNNNNLSWVLPNGYTATFSTAGLTSSHTWVLPDADGTLGTGSGGTLSNVSLVDLTTFIIGQVDATKRLGFNMGGATTGTTVTLAAAQAASCTLTLPGISDTLVARTTTDTLQNKTLLASSTAIANALDTSKRIVFTIDGTPGTTTTLWATPSSNRTVKLPDVTDTLVARTTTDTLTNKTLVDNSTIITSSTGGGNKQVIFSVGGNGGSITTIATAPTASCTVTLPGSTDTLVGRTTTDTLTNKTLLDTTTAIAAAADTSKRVVFTIAGTTGMTTTIATAPTANRTLTVPDATDTLVARATIDTLTNKTLLDTTTVVAAASDTTKRITFAITGTTGTTTTLAAAPVASCTLTLPGSTDTIVARATTDTLTNKTLLDTTTAIAAAAATTKRILFSIGGTTNTTTTLATAPAASCTLTLPGVTDTIVARTTADTLTNKTLLDTTTVVAAASDTTKRVVFAIAGTTGTTTTIMAAPAASCTLTLPGSTDTLVGRATADTLTNKTLTDTSTVVQSGSVAGCRVVFSIAGTTNTTMTLAAAQTANRMITLPDVTDTLVGRTAADTLTNKTLLDTTTAIAAAADTTKRIVFAIAGTTGTTTTLAVAPAASCTLTLPGTTDTIVGRATADTLTNKSLVDSSTAVVDAVDATKQLLFSVGGTTGTTTTLVAAPAASCTLTLPGTTDTIVGRATADTLTNKTLADASTVIAGTVSTKQLTFSIGGSVNTTTTLATAPAASCTLTLPGINDTLVGRTTTDTLTNKTLTDTSTTVQSGTITGCKMTFLMAGSASTATTLQVAQTANRVVTLPDATDTLVGRATADTLTNKTLNSAVNTLTVTSSPLTAVNINSLLNQDVRTTAGPTWATVGAGVITATTQLAVSAAGPAGVQVTQATNAAATTNGLAVISGSTTQLTVGHNQNAALSYVSSTPALRFLTAGTERLRIDTAGGITATINSITQVIGTSNNTYAIGTKADYGYATAAGAFFSNSAIGDVNLRNTDTTKTLNLGVGSAVPQLAIDNALVTLSVPLQPSVTTDETAPFFAAITSGGQLAQRAITSGSFTSTWTTTSGFTSTPTTRQIIYLRLGNVISCSCVFGSTSGAVGTNVATITLPVARASAFSATTQAAGALNVGPSVVTGTGYITATNGSTSTATLTMINISAVGSMTITGTFSYLLS